MSKYFHNYKFNDFLKSGEGLPQTPTDKPPLFKQGLAF